MIRLLHAPAVNRAAEVADLLSWAEVTIDNELASAVELRLAGVATRLAFEFHLHEMCSRIGPPKGGCWHNFAVRLLKAGHFDMGDYRHVRRINRMAARSVHGKPWGRERAAALFQVVQEFVHGRE